MNMNYRSALLSLFKNVLLALNTYISMMIPNRGDRDGVVCTADTKVEDKKNEVSVVLQA